MSQNRKPNAAPKVFGLIIAMVIAVNVLGALVGSGSRGIGVIAVVVTFLIVSRVMTAIAKNARQADGARSRNVQGVRTFGDLETDVYHSNSGAFEAKATGNMANRAAGNPYRARNAGTSGKSSHRATSTVQVSGVNGWEGGRSRHLFHSEPFEQNDGLRHQSWPPRGGFPG